MCTTPQHTPRPPTYPFRAWSTEAGEVRNVVSARAWALRGRSIGASPVGWGLSPSPPRHLLLLASPPGPRPSAPVGSHARMWGAACLILSYLAYIINSYKVADHRKFTDKLIILLY